MRFAVVANCDSPDGLMRAIHVNTMLWGGTFNPIVPVFSSPPDSLLKAPGGPFDEPAKILEATASAYDTDAVISCEPGTLAFPGSLDGNLVLRADADIGQFHVGIGLFEIVSGFIESNLRYVPRTPLTIAVVTPELNLAMVSGLLYGSLPDDLMGAYVGMFEAGDVAHNRVSGKDLYASQFERALTPALMSSWDLALPNEPTVFCMSSIDVFDAVTCWNLRARGRDTIPLPINEPYSDALVEQLAKIIAKTTDRRVTVARAPSIENDAVFEELVRRLGAHLVLDCRTILPGFERRTSPVLGTTDSQHQSVDSDADDVLELRLMEPKLLRHDRLRYGLRYASKVSITEYLATFKAEALPPGISRFSSFPFSLVDEIRVGIDGLVVMHKRAEMTTGVPIPDAYEIVRSYLDMHGYDTEISDKGLEFQQLASLVGRNMSRLMHPNVRKLLEMFDQRIDEAEDTRPKSVTLNQITSRLPGEASDRTLHSMLRYGLLEAGLIAKCSRCNGSAFYDIATLGPIINCARCQYKFELPLHHPSELKWAYRLRPPFVEQGVRRALLGMAAAFGELSDCPGRFTLAAGIVMTSRAAPHAKIEIDILGLQQSNDGGAVTPLFVESKYRQRFEQNDVRRFAELLNTFPFAIYGFTTLLSREEMDPRSLRRIIAFSGLRSGRREASHSTMLLTSREMLPRFEQALAGDAIVGDFVRLAGESARRNLDPPVPSLVEWLDAKERERLSRLASVRESNARKRRKRKAI